MSLKRVSQRHGYSRICLMRRGRPVCSICDRPLNVRFHRRGQSEREPTVICVADSFCGQTLMQKRISRSSALFNSRRSASKGRPRCGDCRHRCRVPTEKSGLREGDVIQEVNKQPVKSAKDLLAISKRLKPNEKILMRVYSQGRSGYVAWNQNSGIAVASAVLSGDLICCENPMR